VGRYFSDYDLLVIFDHDDLTDAARVLSEELETAFKGSLAT
jgi:predicted nucleotidyltransferase